MQAYYLGLITTAKYKTNILTHAYTVYVKS